MAKYTAHKTQLEFLRKWINEKKFISTNDLTIMGGSVLKKKKSKITNNINLKQKISGTAIETKF